MNGALGLPDTSCARIGHVSELLCSDEAVKWCCQSGNARGGPGTAEHLKKGKARGDSWRDTFRLSLRLSGFENGYHGRKPAFPPSCGQHLKCLMPKAVARLGLEFAAWQDSTGHDNHDGNTGECNGRIESRTIVSARLY